MTKIAKTLLGMLVIGTALVGGTFSASAAMADTGITPVQRGDFYRGHVYSDPKGRYHEKMEIPYDFVCHSGTQYSITVTMTSKGKSEVKKLSGTCPGSGGGSRTFTTSALPYSPTIDAKMVDEANGALICQWRALPIYQG